MFLFFLASSSLKSICQEKDKFYSFRKEFVTVYKELKLAPLELSYVKNLHSISSYQELLRQEKVFKGFFKRLKKIDNFYFSELDKLDYDVLSYEIELNIERIAVEKKWKQRNEKVLGSGLYNEKYNKEWYAYFLKKWIDIKASPEEIYHFGLSEIKKVKKEIHDLKKKKGEEILTPLGNEKSSIFLLKDPKEVQNRYELIRETVNKRSKKYFPFTNKIPPLTIKRGINKSYAIVPAYYSNNSFYYNFFEEEYDSRKIGWMYIHEGIPGHHYQTNLRNILPRSEVLSLFTYYSFIEGWGAYVEQFGQQLGAYNSLADKQTQLEWDLIRSVRVALDVGINFYGWSDARALQFWKKHIPHKEDIGKREIKRITRWPVQVITYKYGKKVLDSLKGKLSTSEELKAFHEKVLQNGDVPFSVLKNKFN